MTAFRSIALAALLATASPAIVLAQTSRSAADNPCFHARPAPECRVFFTTNAGGYLTSARTNGGSSFRAIVDLGVMVNASPSNAIGASWFLTMDEDELTTGPAIRYRRWLTRDGSLEVALGTPVAGSRNFKAGSVFGLVKYSPVHWFGIAVRPEYQRRRAFDCGPSSCTEFTAKSGRVYGGAEVGWVPGLVLSLAGVVVGGLAAIFLAGID